MKNGRFIKFHPGRAQIARWIATCLLLAYVGGPAGMLVGVFVGGFLLGGGERRTLLRASAVIFAAVPIAILARGIPPENKISSNNVQQAEWAHQLAFTGAALLVLGILLDQADPGEDGEAQSGRARERSADDGGAA